MQAAFERDTFLNVEACLVFERLNVDIVVVGAAEGTPHIAGQPSHAAGAPDALRRAVKVAAIDPTRWDFDQNGPPLDLRTVR
ncbi:MAG: agmatinase, partial [Hyphomicrobiales bacterium]